MRCLAIDDEPKALAIIKHYTAKVPGLTLLGEFRSGLDALQFLNAEPVDLIFLDINMPDLTGIELLQTLPKPPLVIFTTAYSEYAVQSYDWDAVGYLLKPIEFTKFLKAVNKAQTQLQQKPPSGPTNTSSVHKSFIIALPHVEVIESYQVKIKGHEIPIGKTYRDSFLEEFKH